MAVKLPADAIDRPATISSLWDRTRGNVRLVAGPHPTIDEAEIERPPAWTRWFVGLFLGAFVVCALAGIEAWPLTGWRLFSHLRHEHRTTWQAFAVDASGGETRVSFARLPAAYHGFTLIVSQFGSLPPGRRTENCRTWAAAVRTSGEDVATLRIYRLDWNLVPRKDGRPAVPPTRTLELECR